MTTISLRVDRIPDDLVQDIARRDAALWVGNPENTDDQALSLVADLLALPWSLALCEIADTRLREALKKYEGPNPALERARGFLYPVDVDPVGLELPRRAMPIYFLNGLSGVGALKGLAGLRQRLNMLAKLQAERPRRLLIVSDGSVQPFEDVVQLWRDGFRSLLTVISGNDADLTRFERWASSAKLQSITLIRKDVLGAVREITERTKAILPDDRLVVRMRKPKGDLVDLDVTDCELAEHPILDRYELIQSRHLSPMLPEELSEADFRSFFDRSKLTWSPYAAGLPWDREPSAKARILRTLERIGEAGSEANTIGYVLSESGAGGTTMARTLAYQAAVAGYPALVARQAHFRPESTEIASFLFRVKQRATPTLAKMEAADERLDRETPWVIVFDVTHWAGYLAELRRFVNDLSRGGRPVLVIAVCDQIVGEELQKSRRADRLAVLTHELTQEEAIGLGRHLNRFLKPLGKDKRPDEWIRFWEAHTPTERSSVAAFWVALEFWIKGQLDLSETIQGWIHRQFKVANLDQQARKVVLQIAALTIERYTMPEQLLPEVSGSVPISVVLEQLRRDLPGLALIRENIDSQRHWALAHDLLGRYLINATFFDRALLKASGYAHAKDPVLLRLELLREISGNELLSRPAFRPLAIEFAVKLLKLDDSGNAEFFRYWRQVLAILEGMPEDIRRSSRTFNHHVAISRRRVATHDDYFDASDAEKQRQLELAIQGLEFALNELDRGHGDEPDLNLWNSLALAYQNLADFEVRLGVDAKRVGELRARANAATLRALGEDPTNSYVLETAARNLLQQARVQDQDPAGCASEALGYVFQAVALDRSIDRHHQLTLLANQALKMLRASERGIDPSSKDPKAILARAWLALTAGMPVLETNQLARLPEGNLRRALEVLDEVPEGQSNWLILKFRYDLLVLVAPRDFDGQLRLLDELEGAGMRVPFQMRLERAILLHQRNRHAEANIEYRNLRNALRSFDVIVDVPRRLGWLLSDDGRRYRVCEARVTEDGGHRGYAQVRELRGTRVPFRPEEFGRARMPVGMSFKCNVSFGPMGPFLRPPLDKPVDEARVER